MTEHEFVQRLTTIEKTLAEIAKEREQSRLENELTLQKIRAEGEKLFAEAVKSRAETALIDKKVKWYEVIIAISLALAAGAGLAKLFS